MAQRVALYSFATGNKAKVAEFSWSPGAELKLVVIDESEGEIAQRYYDEGSPYDAERRLVTRNEPELFLRSLVQSSQSSILRFIDESGGWSIPTRVVMYAMVSDDQTVAVAEFNRRPGSEVSISVTDANWGAVAQRYYDFGLLSALEGRIVTRDEPEKFMQGIIVAEMPEFIKFIDESDIREGSASMTEEEAASAIVALINSKYLKLTLRAKPVTTVTYTADGRKTERMKSIERVREIAITTPIGRDKGAFNRLLDEKLGLSRDT